jgi:mannose-6-phosphate isomerase-like protein (cupin superfamily)
MTEWKRLEFLRPTMNLDTVKDGRGGILTYVPPEPVVEWNLIVTKAGKVRGMHWHPHFVEYLLFVDGHGVVVSQDRDDEAGESREVTNVSKGVCTRAPVGVAHTVLAITDLTFVAILTRKWDDSDPPIVQLPAERFGL